jgi:hypothetical protein
MSLLATDAASAIAAASAAAAVGTFFAYLYFAKRSEAHSAQEEALALAQTRAAVIGDLRQQVGTLERSLRVATEDFERRTQDLETALHAAEAEARESAYSMQRFYAASLADLLHDVQANLEREPPNLERALTRIRQLLDDERPAA